MGAIGLQDNLGNEKGKEKFEFCLVNLRSLQLKPAQVSHLYYLEGLEKAGESIPAGEVSSESVQMEL